jgi:hypothetical protein
VKGGKPHERILAPLKKLARLWGTGAPPPDALSPCPCSKDARRRTRANGLRRRLGRAICCREKPCGSARSVFPLLDRKSWPVDSPAQASPPIRTATTCSPLRAAPATCASRFRWFFACRATSRGHRRSFSATLACPMYIQQVATITATSSAAATSRRNGVMRGIVAYAC